MTWFAAHVLPWANAGLELVNLSLLLTIVIWQRRLLAKLKANGQRVLMSGLVILGRPGDGRASDLERPDEAARPPTDPLRH